MSHEHSTVRAELDLLCDHLGRLEGGSEQISDFNIWFFQNAAWEERSSDEILLDLGSGIESILYQWQDFADTVTVAEFVEEIDRELAELGIDRRSIREELVINRQGIDVSKPNFGPGVFLLEATLYIPFSSNLAGSSVAQAHGASVSL